MANDRLAGAVRAALLLAVLALGGCAHPQLRAADALLGGRPEEAFRLLQSEAEAGSPDAQFELGRMYLSGVGVPQNEVQGILWLRRSADAGFAAAQTVLGVGLIAGTAGLTKDPTEGRRLLERAAEHGIGVAQFFVGAMLLSGGEGFPSDRVEGVKWMVLGAMTSDAIELIFKRNPHVRSWKDMDKGIAETLSPTERRESYRRARAWLTRKSAKMRRPPPVRSAGKLFGVGSGVIVGQAAGVDFVVTNFHVIERCRQVNVAGFHAVESVGSLPSFTLSGMRGVDDHSVGYGDLAVLKVTGTSGRRAVALGASGEVMAGDRLLLAGHPGGAFGQRQLKLMPARPSDVPWKWRANYGEDQGQGPWLWMESDAEPGFSGGPVLDDRGRLVGVVSGVPGPELKLFGLRELPRNLSLAASTTSIAAFLDVFEVGYRSQAVAPLLSPAEVEAIAREATVRVECWG
jgi:TPR repeat protein